MGLERALYAYVKDSSHTAPFDLKTVPLATTPMQDQVVKPGKTGLSTFCQILVFLQQNGYLDISKFAICIVIRPNFLVMTGVFYLWYP